MATDSWHFASIAGGLSPFGGHTIVGDATFPSAFPGAGILYTAAVMIDSATFPAARRLSLGGGWTFLGGMLRDRGKAATNQMPPHTRPK